MNYGGVDRSADGVVVAGDQLEVWDSAAVTDGLFGNPVKLKGCNTGLYGLTNGLQGFGCEQTGDPHLANLVFGLEFVGLTHRG